MLRLTVVVAMLLSLMPASLAQQVPAGTVMPVMLQTTLNAKKARVGQKIQARVMQDVSLSSETRIRTGSKLVGHVVEVTRPSKTSGSRIVLTFRSIGDSRHQHSSYDEPALAGFHDGCI